MSRKNHKMIDGRLLQTNKKYSQLKIKQKEKIAEWMFQATRDYYMKKYTFPNDKHLEEVVESRCFVMTAKVYVDVLAVFSREGELIPTAFVWEDGRKYSSA